MNTARAAVLECLVPVDRSEFPSSPECRVHRLMPRDAGEDPCILTPVVSESTMGPLRDHSGPRGREDAKEDYDDNQTIDSRGCGRDAHGAQHGAGGTPMLPAIQRGLRP